MEKVEEVMHLDYFKVFFLFLSPSYLGNPLHLEQLRAMLLKWQGSDKTYLCKLLKEEVNILEETIALKAL